MAKLKKFFAALLAGAAVAAPTGCAEEQTGSYSSQELYSEPLLPTIYTVLTDSDELAPRPLVVIHGLLGSKLVKRGSGEVVWGEFSANGFDEDFLRDLAFPPGEEYDDTTVAEGMLLSASVRLSGITFDAPAYGELAALLEEVGYSPEGLPRLYLFACDWRNSPDRNAALLAKFLREKRAELAPLYREKYGMEADELKFDLVAHSMGGLVARRFLMYGDAPLEASGDPPRPDWSGSELVAKAAIVGTPNSGYLDTVLELANGLRLEAAAPVIPPAVLGTMPAYYSMLPANASGGEVLTPDGEVVNLYDLTNHQKYRWGVFSPDGQEILARLIPDSSEEERLARLTAHAEDCLRRAERLAEALLVESEPPEGLELALFAGDALPTASRAAVRSDGSLKVTEFDAGDGKILTSSARCDRLLPGKNDEVRYHSPLEWKLQITLPAAHMGIVKSRVFVTNLLAFLLL